MNPDRLYLSCCLAGVLGCFLLELSMVNLRDAFLSVIIALVCLVVGWTFAKWS